LALPLAKSISTKKERGLASKHRFDYSSARHNRFAGLSQEKAVIVVLDPDVAKVFKDGESVNAVLRSILKALPRKRRPAS
jgi:hypothetical protein